MAVLATALLLFSGPDGRLGDLNCATAALRAAGPDDRYLIVRFLFEQFANDGERRSVAYRAAFMGTMADLLRRKDVDDSTRLEVCWGARRMVTRAGPLVPALKEYLADVRVRRVNRERGLRGGSGKSVEQFVGETIAIIQALAARPAGVTPEQN